MLMVTENAKRHLKKLLMTNTSDPNLGIRLSVGKGMQLGVLIDCKADDDYVFEHEGVKVLMVGSELFPLVDGAILDIEKNSSGAGLVIAKGKRQPSKKAQETPCTK